MTSPRWRWRRIRDTMEYRRGKREGSMVIEQRISRLEGAYEQVDRRLDEMHQSIIGLRAELNGLRVEMHESINGLRVEMNSRFNTLYVLIAASWVTIIGAMIGLYFK